MKMLNLNTTSNQGKKKSGQTDTIKKDNLLVVFTKQFSYKKFFKKISFLYFTR